MLPLDDTQIFALQWLAIVAAGLAAISLIAAWRNRR